MDLAINETATQAPHTQIMRQHPKKKLRIRDYLPEHVEILNTTSTHMRISDSDFTLKLATLIKTKNNFFTKFNIGHNGEEFGYSWGIGLRDWTPGSTSIEINHWEMIKVNERTGLNFDSAELNIEHIVAAPVLARHKLSVSLSLLKPFSDDFQLAAPVKWAPFPNWYVRTTPKISLTNGDTQWSYGLGYYDWRPGTWAFEYTNYEANDYPFDNFKKGTINISRSWSLGN